jgi:hypothetical protein
MIFFDICSLLGVFRVFFQEPHMDLWWFLRSRGGENGKKSYSFWKSCVRFKGFEPWTLLSLVRLW